MSSASDDLDLPYAGNGLNASTGDYFFEPQTVDQIASRALKDFEYYARIQPEGEVKSSLDKDHLGELLRRHQMITQEVYGTVAWVKAENIAEAGWGVIFPAGDDPKIKAIRSALSELLDLRKQQATANDAGYYREFIGQDGYYADMTTVQFLQKYHATYGPTDPQNVPFYLLIVGDPETIPFSFQYQLDVQYAVGRIYFDTPEEYAQYARSVVMAETGKIKLPRKLVFFGTQNNDDAATHTSATMLVVPLRNDVLRLMSHKAPWQVDTYLGPQATKEQLLRLVGGTETPALLFTASHGAAFNKGDRRQIPHQGAFICQDWPGPKQWGRSKPIPPDFYVASDDIIDEARPLGMIGFHFACFGAGTPERDDFSYTSSRQIAEHSFMARLPQRLLGHPKGGALALIGHVERAWDYSFKFDKDKTQIQTFMSTLYQLMTNYPIGVAMDFLNNRYATVSSAITAYQHRVKQGLKPNNYELASMWMVNNDARSYVIIGDPAVRAAV